MAKELLSTEIVNQGVKGSGPDKGSLSFSVKVKRGIPDFLNSVNLKYVKLGYTYLIDHGLYLVMAPVLVLVLITGAEMGNLTSWEEFFSRYGIIHAVSAMGLVAVMVYVYFNITPRPTYLLDFSCYRPPAELKVSKENFIELAKKSGNFDDSAIEFQHRVLKNSGIGDETYLPKSVFHPGHKITLKDGRDEAAMVIFGAIDDLLAKTGIRAKDINILVVNCGTLNTTPSLSAMVVNHYKLRPNVHSFNLGGMGCAAGAIAIDLAKDMLSAHPGSYALVVSTEVVSHTWYMGKDKDMLLPNCFFRMGAAAMLLSNRLRDWWYSKYELKHLGRNHTGMENRSLKCIHTKEDAEGRRGISVSKDLMEVGRHAFKDKITTLGSLAFPSKKTKPDKPDYQLAFEHVCILAASRMILDELQKNLELTNEYMEASRMTLQRFGNTSSSSVWYELAYLEANQKIKKGDRIWQINFGSGFKCNSVIWKALKKARTGPRNPWIEQ